MGVNFANIMLKFIVNNTRLDKQMDGPRTEKVAFHFNILERNPKNMILRDKVRGSTN